MRSLIFIVLFSLSLISVFVNSIYFSISLLFIVLLLASTLVSYLKVTSLTFFLLMLVYLGAMMILIGYVCAISPNVLISESNKLFPIILLSFLGFISVPILFSDSYKSTMNLSDFFYSSWGLLVFSSLVFILALTLLIVTSQYISPKGPFRAISI